MTVKQGKQVETALQLSVAFITPIIGDTQTLQVDPPLYLGIKMKRPAVSQPQQGIKHSALSPSSRTFAPAPSALADIDAENSWLAKTSYISSTYHLLMYRIICNKINI